MKTIKINRICLHNFKCHDHLELEPMGESLTIYGDNATGKTSIYDALTWLLFGKDSKGSSEKLIDLKPLTREGKVRDREALTWVEATLRTQDGMLRLKRTLKELWTYRKGSMEPIFEGNVGEYAIDGVPCKKSVYDRTIEELVGEELFRILTGISCFASELDWRKRRAVLWELSGLGTDGQIMETSEEFHPLVEELGSDTVQECRKRLLARKKELLHVRNSIPERLDAYEDMERELTALDFDAERSIIADLEERKRKLLRQQEDAAKATHERVLLKRELALLEEENRSFCSRGERKALHRKQIASQLSRLEAQCEDVEASIEAARLRWLEVQEERFQGGCCPTCGQRLPTEQLARANESFEAQKQARLREIDTTAASRREMLQELQQRCEELRTQLSSVDSNETELHDMPDYERKRKALERQIAALEGGNAADAKALETVERALAEHHGILGKEGTLLSIREKIETLRGEAALGAAALEQTEALLRLLDAFERYKCRFVEERVNGFFRLVRFRLFREQANGGLEERCDITVNGIPYASLNNGSRINAGIDIINTLSAFYGVRVPLFIDNAESVTRPEYANTQVIRLMVSEQDKVLRIVPNGGNKTESERNIAKLSDYDIEEKGGLSNGRTTNVPCEGRGE